MSNEQPKPVQEPGEHDEGLQYAADKIGFVPNLRKSDNVFQLQFIGITSFACILFALIAPLGDFPILAKVATGLLAGLFVGVILSGIVLAIKNLKR